MGPGGGDGEFAEGFNSSGVSGRRGSLGLGGLLTLLLEPVNLLLGLGDVLSCSPVSRSFTNCTSPGNTNRLGDLVLVILVVLQLLPQLLEHVRYVLSTGGRRHINFGQLLEQSHVEVELGRSSGSSLGVLLGGSSTALLALLLSSGANEVILLLLNKFLSPERLNVAGSLRRELSGSSSKLGLPCGLSRARVKESDEGFASDDLLSEHRDGGFLKLLGGGGTLLPEQVLGLLSGTAFIAELACFPLIGAVCIAALVEVVLELLERLPFLLLDGLEPSAFVAEGLEVLVTGGCQFGSVGSDGWLHTQSPARP